MLAQALRRQRTLRGSLPFTSLQRPEPHGVMAEEGLHRQTRLRLTLLWPSPGESGKLHNLSGPQFPLV